MQFPLVDSDATVDFGALLGKVANAGGVIYLEGDLGMGKTTLSRGLIQGLGYKGAVKSPTYTLVESYPIGESVVHHFDLYRLADAEELEFIGIRDYFEEDALSLIEWPNKGAGMIPSPDLRLVLTPQGEQRLLLCQGESEKGLEYLKQLSDKLRSRG